MGFRYHDNCWASINLCYLKCNFNDEQILWSFVVDFVVTFRCSYGDTAPKSIPARLYSVLWMLLGMVAFSVLTANFTSSLNYEIAEDLSLFGKKVGVFLCWQ